MGTSSAGILVASLFRQLPNETAGCHQLFQMTNLSFACSFWLFLFASLFYGKSTKRPDSFRSEKSDFWGNLFVLRSVSVWQRACRGGPGRDRHLETSRVDTATRTGCGVLCVASCGYCPPVVRGSEWVGNDWSDSRGSSSVFRFSG